MDNTNIPEEDGILTFLEERIKESQPKVSVLNFKRYMEMMAAKKALNELLRQNNEPECRVKVFPSFCSGSLSAEFENLEVCDLKLFFDIMARADNFEIYPLVSGKVRIAFMFRSLLIGIE